jgi:hypothetical protein
MRDRLTNVLYERPMSALDAIGAWPFDCDLKFTLGGDALDCSWRANIDQRAKSSPPTAEELIAADMTHHAKYGMIDDDDAPVYTVRLADRIFVLHAFQKKSTHGIATPQSDIELIKRRLKQAVAISEARE